jgi:hypothetical protein
MDRCKKEIRELVDKITPTTPPKLKQKERRRPQKK